MFPGQAVEADDELLHKYLESHDLTNEEIRKAAREAGKVRVEGKEYVVQDGDIIKFYIKRTA